MAPTDGDARKGGPRHPGLSSEACTDSVACSGGGPTVWLAGHYVAVYAVRGSPVGPLAPGSVRSINLASGKTQRRVKERVSVLSLVLKKNGSFVAVTIPTELPPSPELIGPRDVKKSDAGGQATLDSGNIDPESLALSSGSTFYWLKDAKPFWASLE
jgi:hypothetical protein